MNWMAEVNWATQHAKGKSANAAIYRASLASCIYRIWLERNQRVFQRQKTKAHVLVKQVIQDIHGRGAMHGRLHSRLASLNFYP